MNDTTNTEFITELMEHSRHGALIQAFVFEALHYYAERVEREPEGALNSGLISEEAWRDCADEVIKKLNRRLKRPVEG